MTMDLKTQKAALKAWVIDQAHIPAVWREEPRIWTGKTRALLNLNSTRARGVDETQYGQDTDLPAGRDMVLTVRGNRNLTLAVLVESRDQTPEGDAQFFIEKLRTSLHKPYVRDVLRAAGLSFSEAGSVVNLDDVVQGRVESRAQLDFIWNAVVEEVEADVTKAKSYVDKVQISAGFDKGDGTGPSWTAVDFGNVP